MEKFLMAQVDTAALFALSSALCVAIGDVMQQRATHRIADTSLGQFQLFAKLLGNRRWRWGAALLVVSIVLQGAALDRGSVLLVQALLVLSLLFAMPISARLSHRAVTGREWLWALLLTGAVTVIVTVGDPQPGHSTASPRTWIVVVAVLGPLLAACVVAARIWTGAVAAALLAFVSGSLWAVFAVLTKGVVHRITDGGWELVRTPELYAWLLVGLAGFGWEQSAFRAGPLTASMPTLEVSQPVVAALLGVVVLGETLNTGGTAMIVLAVAALVMTAATIELARVDASVTRKQLAADLPGAAGQPA
jgi:drug/metabolite transporter (DMT)-like permease